MRRTCCQENILDTTAIAMFWYPVLIAIESEAGSKVNSVVKGKEAGGKHIIYH